MKKLIILFSFLLLASISYSQVSVVSYAQPSSSFRSSYTAAYIGAMANPIVGIDTLGWLDDLLFSLDSLGFMTRMDVGHLEANRNVQAASLSIVDPTGDDNLTDLNTTSFAPYNGYDGNSTDDGLNTNFNPATEGVNFTKDDATIIVWMTEESNEDRYAIGSADASANWTSMFVRSNGDNKLYAATNSDTRLANNNSTGIGFSATTRRSSTDVENYGQGNGTSLGSGSVTSTSIPSLNLYLLCRNNNGTADGFSGNEIAFDALLDGMTTVEIGKFYTPLNRFMTRIGL